MELNYYTPGMSKEIVPILETALDDISKLLECNRQFASLKMITFMVALVAGEAVIKKMNEGEIRRARQGLIDIVTVGFDMNLESYKKQFEEENTD